MGPLQHRPARRLRGLKPVVDVATELPRPADEVWAAVTTPAGVNAELGPFLSMTFPGEALTGLSGAPLRPGRRVSWLMALRIFPLERLIFVVNEVAERRMVESAHGVVERLWRHERRIEPLGDGCVVRDIVTAQPRIAWTRPLLLRLVAALFRHRHKRLRLLFS